MIADGRIDRFNVLLALLLLAYALDPFVSGPLASLPRIAIELTLLSALWSLGRGSTIPWIATAVMVVNEASAWLLLASPDPTVAALHGAATVLFLLVALSFLTWGFWNADEMGAGFLAGAVSIYVLLGFFWSAIFTLLELGEPGSFRDACAPRLDGSPGCDPTTGSYPRLVYFGFVTMTTLGYGDIVPLTLRAERLTTLACVTGPLFLAVMIGRLVSLTPARRDPEA
jgi:hypothetical protein